MYNFKRGVVDCRANQYHNKEFVTVASKVGLVCVRHRSQGWVTTLETSNSNAIMPQVSAIQHRSKVFNDVNLDKGILRRAKIYFGQLSKRNRQAIYFLKYECQCPPPHNSIRSGRRPDGEHPLNIMCLDCKGMFNCVDLEDR
jgi:hypothetical protein